MRNLIHKTPSFKPLIITIVAIFRPLHLAQTTIDTSSLWRRLLATSADLVDIRLTRTLVRRSEKHVDVGVFGEPCQHAGEFFAETVYGLGVHVCLGDEFGHCY